MKYQRPIAKHTKQTFDKLLFELKDYSGELILDACCGVGESTAALAKRYPEAVVIGVDKSAERLAKHGHYAKGYLTSDAADSVERRFWVIQADLNDFWRLLADALTQSFVDTLEYGRIPIQWRLVKQYILYPNPYPKKAQLGKRWHASPVFPYILKCTKQIEVRSNWKLYVDEFAKAANAYNVKMQVTEHNVDNQSSNAFAKAQASRANTAISPFERKYALGGQALWTAITCCKG